MTKKTMLIEILNSFKSIPSKIKFELPSFTVLTGINGSGKTHLLHSLTIKDCSRVTIDQSIIPHNQIRFISFGGLIPQQEQAYNPQTLITQCNSLWSQLERAITKTKADLPNINTNDKAFEAQLINKIEQQRNQTTRADIRNFALQKDVLVQNLTEADISEMLRSKIQMDGNFFSSQFSQMFKLYHVRHLENKLKKVYLDEDPNYKGTYLENSEFEKSTERLLGYL